MNYFCKLIFYLECIQIHSKDIRDAAVNDKYPDGVTNSDAFIPKSNLDTLHVCTFYCVNEFSNETE